jgi:hypothetical protein
MGQGSAQIRSRMVRVLAVCGSAAMALAAFTTLAAAAWIREVQHPRATRIALLVDTTGPLGLSVPLPPLAAGDVQQRTVTLRNGGGGPLSVVAVTVVASGGSPLAQDARYGLRLRIDRCSRPWLATKTATLRCPGTQEQLMDWKAVALGIAGRSVGGVPSGEAAWLRISAQLPAAAPANLESLAAQLQYRFTAA